MENVRRIYVEKKNGFDVEAKGVLADLKENLSLKGLKDVRIINRYDVSGVSDEEYQKARNLIFSEPPVDNAYDEEIEISEGKVFAVEFYPGQFDQRAASAEEMYFNSYGKGTSDCKKCKGICSYRRYFR